MKHLLLTILALLLCAATGSARAQYWAFRPPVLPAVPSVRHKEWVKNPIDAFILQKLERKGLSPTAPADKLILLRRITFDLTGLPPTPAALTAFLSDRRSGAYERVVQRLLSSPRFGERWAQHWLDVVRFAESNGYEHDLDRPQAWRYRDWVVNAFNSDMGYDRFLQSQVAGDLIKPDSFDQRVATGFLRTGPFHITGGNLDPLEMRQEWLTEVVAGIGNGVLGLTIGCARCHDHKFDPIPQSDFYRLQACFAGAANLDTSNATEFDKKRFEDAAHAIKERIKPIGAQIAAIEKPYREQLRVQKIQKLAPDTREALTLDAAKRTPIQKKLASEAEVQLTISWDEVVNVLIAEDRAKRAVLRRQSFELEREMPLPLPEAEGVADIFAPAPAMRLLIRGDVHTQGPVVQPGFPGCLCAATTAVTAGTMTHPRLELARWLTTPENPLTTRVFVNRLWHYLFGKGIVATPNDFGHNGQLPTHPELLDWLAVTFSGDFHWSVKKLIALMVTSNAYIQGSGPDRAKSAVDPDNRLLWRMNRKRLDAEALRDSILATDGTLNLQVGGPSIRVPLEPEVYDTIFTESEPDNLWPATPDVKQHTRRSLYLFRKRNVRLPMLALFDQPDMMSSCGARGQTVHALQALTLVNSAFMRDHSFILASRLMRDARESEQARIDRLFTLALCRPPSTTERRATVKFLADQSAIVQQRTLRGERIALPADLGPRADVPSTQALADLCLATMNLNEFLYLK